MKTSSKLDMTGKKRKGILGHRMRLMICGIYGNFCTEHTGTLQRHVFAMPVV